MRVLLRRCQTMGWPVRLDPAGQPADTLSLQNLNRAKDQRFGTPWGRLRLAGEADQGAGITARQYDAAEAFHRLHWAYAKAIDAPRQFPSIARLDASMVAAMPWIENEDATRQACIRYGDAERALRSCPGYVVRAVMALCVREEFADLHHIRQGLDALARHLLG